MRYAKEHKAETRQKILTAAARLFREYGYDGVGVDTIMAAAGLTVGGFYSHFASKQALFAETITTALNPQQSFRTAKGRSTPETDALSRIINAYLSRTHRDQVADGCPLPVLTPDVARADQRTRECYEQQLLLFLQEIETWLPQGASAKREMAIALIAQCVGGLMIARAVKDPQLSESILKACRKGARKLSERND